MPCLDNTDLLDYSHASLRMKKEVFLAISIGFVLGLIITFGIWTANKSLKQLPAGAITPSPSPVATAPGTNQPAPTSVPTTSGALTVTAPDDEFLTNTAKVTVTGKATANSPVVILYETGDVSLTTDASGNFTADVPLEGGYNLITVIAYDANGTQSSITRTVTYTTQKI